MTSETLLVGPLAHPALCDALNVTGRPETIRGRLTGGYRAGITDGHWPGFIPGDGQLVAQRVQASPELERYLAVMGLQPVNGMTGVQQSAEGGGEWAMSGWRAELPAAIARLILEQPSDQQADQIRRRLPMLAVWAASRLRAGAGPVSGGTIVPRRSQADIRWHDMRQTHAGFFSVEEWQLSHRTHAGGFTAPGLREGFISGDAVVVLPWDPVRDRVLIIEQFRFAPALRRDPQPWLLEAIAGRIDPGETAEEAAYREAREEAGLNLTRLIPAVHHYPSPGVMTEYLYLYIAVTDLPDGITGIHGLDEEGEDIKGHLLSRADLLHMVLAGQISSGPLATIALWLETQAARFLLEL